MNTKFKKQLHWTCDSPSHYNDVLFQAIGSIDTINLLVHYRRNSLSSHPWKTLLRVGYNSRIQNKPTGIDLYLLKTILFEKESTFMFGGWAGLNNLLLIITCIVLKRKYMFWTDTPNVSRNRNMLFAIARHFFLQICFKCARFILCTGNPAMDTLRSMGAKKEKLINFPYWVDIKRLHPISQVGNIKTPIRFISAGRIVNSLKGHDVAIRSLAKVSTSVPMFDFTYIIAGTGSDVEKLTDLAIQLGINKKVTILGWTEPDELVKLLHNSDVFLHPSPTHEPYGVAVIEAMAAGLVVLASDLTGAGLDRIVHGVNGFIHRAGDVDALSEQILWIFNNSDQLSKIKLEARKTAEKWPVEKGVEIVKMLITEHF